MDYREAIDTLARFVESVEEDAERTDLTDAIRTLSQAESMLVVDSKHERGHVWSPELCVYCLEYTSDVDEECSMRDD